MEALLSVAMSQDEPVGPSLKTIVFPERNNTNYSKALQDFIKSVPKDATNLQYHQKLVHDYVMQLTGVDQRGVLINHGMGAGKTRLGISICESLLQSHPEWKVVFLSAKSLHANATNTLRDYLKLEGREMDEASFQGYVKQKYIMVSMNASNMYEQVARSQGVQGQVGLEDLGLGAANIQTADENSKDIVNLDDCVVVVDEAHNFFNSIVNGSENSVRLYYLIMRARRIRVIFMTGSIIVNDPFEIALAYNMLTGYLGRGKDKETSLFGEDYIVFAKSFCPDNPDINPDDDPMEVVPSKDTDSRTVLAQRLKMPVIKNRAKFQNRIIGLTSTYHLSTAESKEAAKLRERFPTMNPIHIQRIPMSDRQFSQYAEAREKELAELKRSTFRAQPKGLSKAQGASSTYRVRSRQLSNIVYPEEAIDRKMTEKGKMIITKLPDKLTDAVFQVDWKDKMQLDAIKPLPTHRDETDSRTEEAKPKNAKPKDAKPKKGGAAKAAAKITKAAAKIAESDGLAVFSPKIFTLLCNASVHLPWIVSLDKFRQHAATMPRPDAKELITGPGIVYSQFRESGIDMVARALKVYGFQDLADKKDANDTKTPTYAVISGEIPAEQRAENLRIYNQPENADGKIIAILLVTATGAEGIDTKGTTHMHALEPYWHIARLDQFWARAVRLGAFDHLPAKRRFVQPYLYLAEYPRGEEDLSLTEPTTDINLYLKSLQNKVLINSFLLAIEEASIDCSVHHHVDDSGGSSAKSKKYNCRMCAPSNERAFQDDLATDLATPDTCKPLRETKIKALSISMGDVEYMYYTGEDGATHIFEQDPNSQAYREIFADHPDYRAVSQQISKLGSKRKTS